jgi:hypothetical protein
VALGLCERGADVSTPAWVDKEGAVLPLVLAVRFREAALCRCILAQQQTGHTPDEAAALGMLELLDHARNRGWSVAVSRSLLVLPAGGGSRHAFDAEVMRSALAASAPLRRLHDNALAARGPRGLIVRAADATAAIEAWALPTAAVLAARLGGGDSAARARDAHNRTALHLAALDGWTSVISLLRSAAAPMGGEPQRCGGDASACAEDVKRYLPSALALATDLFGRTALHLARGRAVAAAVLNATAPTDRAALLAVRDATGAVRADYEAEVAEADGSRSFAVDDNFDDEFDSGGWDRTVLAEAATDCQFDAVNASALTAARFASHYMLRSRPLLIRQAIPATSGAWPTPVHPSSPPLPRSSSRRSHERRPEWSGAVRVLRSVAAGAAQGRAPGLGGGGREAGGGRDPLRLAGPLRSWRRRL